MDNQNLTAIHLEKTMNHPCYNCGASGNARIHLPVAPKCNIQCNYCVRKFDCVNESRPGVVSSVLSPEEAVARYFEVKKTVPKLTVAGIAGPGDALANFEEVRETLRQIRRQDPDVTFCLSTNGLMLPFYANELVTLGVSHVTVTMNTVDAATGTKIYDHINYLGKTYSGMDGAAILLHNQLSGIRYLAAMGVVIKVNIVLLKGINEYQIEDIVRTAKDCGCNITNIMQLIPVDGSKFAYMELVSNADLNRIRKQSANILPQMYHCKQCRADAIGTLEDDLSYKFGGCSRAETSKEQTEVKGRCRFAVCSKDGERVDQHFGQTDRFLIYDYQDGAIRLVEARLVEEEYSADPEQSAEEDRIARKVKRIDECDAVVCMRIGSNPSRVLRDTGLEVFTTYDTVETALQKAAKELLSRETVGASCS